MTEERYRHYYGLCETDNVLVQIEVTPDAGDGATLPDREDWDEFGLRCPVCGDTVTGGYDGADNLTTDDMRTRQVRAESSLRVVRERVAALHVRYQAHGADGCDLCRQPWPCETIAALGVES